MRRRPRATIRGMTRTLVIASALLLSACTNTRVQANTIQAPHDPQATRTWWIVRDKGGDDHVVVCDMALAAAGRPLCMWWPVNWTQ